MAENTEVGTAYVAIIPSAKGFAKQLQKAIAKEFAGTRLDTLIDEALAGTTVSVPVTPTIDPGDVPDEVPVRRGREPELPVRLDPLVAAFQAQIRRELTGLTDQAATEIPVGADTDELRTEVADAIAQIEASLSAEVPTEPADRREYERQLREQIDAVSGRVRATIDADVDVDVDDTRADVDAAGEKIGRNLADSVTSNVTQGFSLAGPAVFGGLVAAGVLAGPLIAAAIAGGVLTALGGGVIGLALFALKDDPLMQRAASGLAGTIQSTLAKAAGPLLGTEEKPGPILLAMETLTDLVVELGPSLEQLFASIGPYIPVLAEGFAEFLREAMPGILRGVEAAGPLLEVIALNLGPLGETVGGFLSTMALLGPAAADAFNFIFFLINQVIGSASTVLYALGAFFSFLYDQAQLTKDRLGAMWDFISAVFSRGAAFVGDKAEAMVGWVLRQIDRLTGGSKRGIDTAVGFFAGLPGRAKAAVGDLGSLLYQAGKNVVQGLINGMKAMFGPLGNVAGSLAGTIRNYLPFSPAKEGPLSGRGNPYYSGQSIVDLLASGITGNLGTARAAAGTLAETLALSGAPLTTPPAGGYALAASTLATPAPHLEWAPGMSGDPLLDALRQMIRISYGGDVQAAIGTGGYSYVA